MRGLVFTVLAVLLSHGAHAQDGSIYMRPDGNGYYYHGGGSPFRPPALFPEVDDIILHEDLERRRYDRSQIFDTGVRYGNLTPEQQRALAQELRNSRERDQIYHRGYHRGRSPVGYGYVPPVSGFGYGYGYVPPQPWRAPYRAPYRAYAY